MKVNYGISSKASRSGEEFSWYKRKLFAQLVTVLLFILTLISIVLVQSDYRAMLAYGIFAIVSLFVQLILWKYVNGELFSPIPMTMICLYLFNLGQCIIWLLGEQTTLNVYQSGEHSVETIVCAEQYILLCLSLFSFGTYCVRPYKEFLKKNIKLDDSGFKEQCLLVASILIALITFPSYFINLASMFSSSMAHGYAYIYTDAYQSSVSSMNTVVANLFEPAMLALLVAVRKDIKKRNLIIGCFIFLIALKFMIGGRSGGVAAAIALMVFFYFQDVHFTKKTKLILIIVIIALVVAASITQTIRSAADRSFDDFVKALTVDNNIIVNTCDEFGWSISPLLYTMELVPGYYPLRFGFTYLISLTSIIPNLGFWAIHPAEQYASLTNWVTHAANHTWSGVGYSSVAESFINFSWFGCIVFVVWGALIAWLVFRGKESGKKSPLLVFIILACFLCLFTSFVRGDFHDMVRAFSWRILPVIVAYIGIGFVLRIRKKLR